MKINFLQNQSSNIPNNDFIVQHSKFLKQFLSQQQQQQRQKQIILLIKKQQFENFKSFLYNPILPVDSSRLVQIISVANYLDFDYNDYEHLKGWINLLRSIDKKKYDSLPEDLIYEIEKAPLITKIKKLFSQNLDNEYSTLDFLEIFGLFEDPSVFTNIRVPKNIIHNILHKLGHSLKVQQNTTYLESFLKTNWTEWDFHFSFNRWIDILIGSLETDTIATIYDRLKIIKQRKQAQRSQQRQKQQYVARKTRIPRELL